MAAVAGSGITDAASSSMPSESVPSSTVAGRALSAGPAARELRQLQNRLDKALVKCNEAAAIKGTYESVLSRLKAEAPKMEAAIRTLQVGSDLEQAFNFALCLSPCTTSIYAHVSASLHHSTLDPNQ